MNPKPWILFALLSLMLITFGCSGGQNSSGSPAVPNMSADLSSDTSAGAGTQTHLWGYYDVVIDIESQTAHAVLNRNAMFTANVVTFVNMNPLNLDFDIKYVSDKPSYYDVDIDVSITHPFATAPEYKGYDVRGVFIGDGSETLKYNGSLKYSCDGVDQTMLDDTDLTNYPDDQSGGGPDGYTRWFNPDEFKTPGVLGYTNGLVASPGYKGTATLNPYRYFADDLCTNDDAWEFLTVTDGDGVFSNGETNTRNYYIRFPKSKGVQFAYAIAANWKGTEPDDHPSNADEPLAASIIVTDGVYYTDSSLNGGFLIFDISLFDWDAAVSGTGEMTDYILKIDSTVLSSVYTLNSSEMTPVGGNDVYSTYHVEIEADDVTGTDSNEFWVIAECEGFDYTNDFGISNDADSDTLAAFFRYDINVSEIPPNYPPYITGIEDDIIGGGNYEHHVDYYDASVTYTALFYDLDPGDTHTFAWFITESGIPVTPIDEVAMPIDWSTYAPGNYDIYVDIDDGTVTVRGGPYPILMNTVPVVNSGVDGKDNPLLVNTETYSVDVTDPDIVNGQILTYSWTVTDVATGDPLSGYDGIPGDGETLDVDWNAIGAIDEQEFEIDCTISDGMTEVYADTLDVTTTVNLYFANFEDGDGDMVVQYSYYSQPERKWNYDTGYFVWKESGTSYTLEWFNRYTRSRLRTPIFSVPAGISQVKVDLRQWAGGSADSGDRCYLQYSINGTSYATLTYWSTVIHGSSGYDIVETFNLPGSMIDKPNAAIGFYFYSDFDSVYMGTGWNLREVRVYIVP